MLKTSFAIAVHSTYATLWQILLDKAENPGKYVPGFIESDILERTSESTLCRLHTVDFDILERIRVDETLHTVTFEVVDHPRYTGQLINRIEPEPSPDGHPVLTYAMDWRLQPGASSDIDFSNIVHEALLRTKAIAEERERGNDPEGIAS